MNGLQTIETVKAIQVSSSPRGLGLPFYLVLLYLLLEFGRPQASIPGLGVLHLPGIVSTLLAITLVFSGRLQLSDKQTKLFICLLALMTLHVPIALNNYKAFEATRTMLITFVAYLGIITFADSLAKYQRMINTWVSIHVYLAIAGIIKGGRGIGGFIGDENDFCLVLNMIVPFTFFMALEETNRFKKMMYMGLTALFVFTIMLTFSRGGFVGLVAVGIYCLFRTPKKFVSAVAVALLVAVMYQYAPDKYGERVQSIQEEGTSSGTGEDRVYMWRIGWAMFLDNAILGVGPENFPVRFRQYEIASGFEEGLHGRSRAWRAAHSLYFTLLPELGIVGALIFAGMLFSIHKDLRFMRKADLREYPGVSQLGTKKIISLSLAMGGSLIGFLVSGTFISVLYYPSFWILMGFVVTLKKVSMSNYEDNLTPDRDLRPRRG